MQNLGGRICYQTDKLVRVYFGPERSATCTSCIADEREMVLNNVAVKQSDLKKEQMKSQQWIQEKQKKMLELKRTVDSIKRRSRAAVEESEKIFTDLIRSLEKKRSEVTELIRAQEKTELNQTERLLNQLEREITDLQRRLSELEQLSHTDDDIRLLQRFPSLRVSPGCDDSPDLTFTHHLSFDGARKCLSDLKKHAEQISAAVQMILPSKLESREEFLQYFRYLNLDPNTAHPQLVLSEKNRAVTCTETDQTYSHHPERFDSWEQVLCKESVCGRGYWEVEWTGDTWVSISVSYKDISRKGLGYECGFGRNSQSWSLQCSSSSVSFWHNEIKTLLEGQASSRIGVYVDPGAGTLSFYSVSDTMKLLHRVRTAFTQPLYAGIYLWQNNSTVRLCVPKEMMRTF